MRGLITLLRFLPRIFGILRGLVPFLVTSYQLLRNALTALRGMGLFGYVMQKVAIWVAMWLAGGVLFRIINLSIMIMVYAYAMNLIDRLVLSDLGNQLLDSFNLLPSSTRCVLQLLGIASLIKIMLSTAASVGTVKLMIKVVTRA